VNKGKLTEGLRSEVVKSVHDKLRNYKDLASAAASTQVNDVTKKTSRAKDDEDTELPKLYL